MNNSSFFETSREQKRNIINGFKNHLSSGKAKFYEEIGIDFVLGKREGPYIYDICDEKQIINCNCNGGVHNLGHRNPEILKALKEALEYLDIGNHHLVSQFRVDLANTFTRLTPGNLDYVVFGVSGGESVDLGLKIARGFTGKNNIISAKGGYHGHTGLALAAGDEQYRKPFGKMSPGFMQIPFNNMAALESAIDQDTAAVILETIPATCGISIPDPDYFLQVREICDKNGVLLIVDEVQAGLGRTGKLWGIEHFDIVPDIMIVGKGLSGGFYPITATCFSNKLETVFHDNPFIHISTFGGSELGCIVASKVLDISSDEKFLKQVTSMGEYFKDGFETLRSQYPAILSGLRQIGLMMGIEMQKNSYGPLFTQKAFENGVLSVYSNNSTNISQLMPPLNTDQKLADEILNRIEATLKAMTKE